MQFSNIIDFDPSIQILSDNPSLPLNNLQEIVTKSFQKPSEKIFSDPKKLHDYVFKKVVAACIEACQEGGKTEVIKKISFSVVGIKDLSGRSIFQAIIQDEKQLDVTRFLYKLGDVEVLQTTLTCDDYQLDMQFAASKNRCDLLPLLSRIGNRMGHSTVGTPLHIAIDSNSKIFAKKLLELSDVYLSMTREDPVTKLKLTPFSLAVARGNKKCFDILIEKSKNRECFKEIVHGAGNFLHLAIMCGRTEMLEHLLTQYSEDVKFLIDDGKSHHGCTPLIMAADQGDVEALMLLHSHGANVEGKDSEGRTALHHAVIKNQVQTIELLIFLKADVNAIDHLGKRPEYYTKNNQFLEKIMTNALLNQDLMENRRPNFVEYYPENLVFQGGGPAGICHLGALKELEKKQILSKAIRMAGTSAGSIIAAFLSIGYTVDEAKKLLMATKLIDLMDYSHLSRPLPEFITHGKKVVEGISEQKGFFKKFIKFITSVKIKDISDAKIIFKDLKKTTGLSKGEVLRAWIGAVIKGKTGDENLTFGELREKIKQGSPYKHLHVFVTDIGTGPNIIGFNSEDEKYDSIIIADAVRASAGLPGVFEPHIIHHKVEGRRQPFNDRLLVDGGILYNLPVEAFDKKKWIIKTDLPTEEGECPMFNKRTLAISLDGSEGGIEENEAPPRSVFAVLGKSAKIYFNAENNIRETVPYNNHRIIKINRLNVTALDFNITREKMEELMESGVQAVEKFFEKQELSGVEAATEFLMLRDKRLSRFLSESNKNIPKISVTQECLSLAKTVARHIDEQSEKDRFLLMIVKIEAKYTIQTAKETAEKIKDSKVQSKALLEIVTVEAQDSIRGAKETAEKIQDPVVKTSALLLIAMMAKDFIEAKKIVTQIKDLTDRLQDQIKIAKAEGKGDYKETKKIANQIKNSTEKANALLEIAKGEAKFDIKAAKETINSIKEQTPFWKTKALLAIAKEEGKSDFSYVRDSVEKIEDPSSQVTLLIHIGQAEGKGNFDSAKQKANKLKGSLKINALRDIAKAEGKGDFRSAKQNIDLILDLSYKAQVLQEIAIEEVLYSIKIAKKTAKLIQVQEKKHETLRIIALFEAKDDVEMMKKVIGQNKNSDKEDNALLKIVQVQAEDNCAKAKETVHLIQESWCKDMALKEIALIEAKSDFEGAKQTLLLFQEESFKIDALLKIAELDIKGPQQLKNDKGDNGRLLSAIKSYDHKLVEELLKNPQFNVNAKHKKSGRTGLHLSLLLKNMDAFEQLLQCQKMDADIWDNDGNSPLYLAVKMGNDKAIDLLLKRKGIERDSIIGDNSLLYSAVKSKDKKLFSWLLKHHEFNLDAQDEKGRSLLHFLIQEEKELPSNDNFLKLEMSSPEDFIVPLSLTQQGNIENTFLAQLLQDGQMNVDIQDNDGYSPLHQAMLLGNKQALYLLLRHKGLQDFTLKNCFPLLYSAMNSKDYGLLNFCFNVLKMDVNVQDGEGCTLLHRSLLDKDSVATGLILKQKGVDLSIEDNKGFTPLFLSVYFKNDKAADLLLQCRNFWDPLLSKDLLLTCAAIKFKDKMLLEWCKENTKFDVNGPDKEGLTLLQKAVIDQKMERCEMLLLLPGIDLNVVDNKGRTLLHICIENKDHASLELLLKQDNMDVNLQNAEGKTPIVFALMNQDMAAVSLISKHPKLKY